jgi:hypothetical protein
MKTITKGEFEKRLLLLDKDLQKRVNNSKDKLDSLVKCELIYIERDKNEFILENKESVAFLSKSNHDKIFKGEWNVEAGFHYQILTLIKNINKKTALAKIETREMKKLDDAVIQKKKNPLRLKINGEIKFIDFFVFKKTDSQEIIDKKYSVIKSISDNLKGDVVRLFRLMNYFEIPINEEKRAGSVYVYAVKNLNGKKKRIYISTKKDYDFKVSEFLKSKI